MRIADLNPSKLRARIQSLLFLSVLLDCRIGITLAAAPEFFGTTNVCTVELTLTAEQWSLMQSGQAPKNDLANQRPSQHPNLPYVHAEARVGAVKFADVGLRIKGSGTMAGANEGRPPFKLDFNRFIPGQSLFGVTKVSLNNNHYDSSFMRDALSYDLFRRFNIPAPRTTYAKVYVNVAGIMNHKYLGLYTLTEAVEKRFLKRQFGSADGLLCKPNFSNEGFGTGRNWAESAGRWQPKTPATEQQQQRLLDFIRLVNNPNEAEFRREIANYLDVDEYLRFLTGNVVLANLDSYLGMGKNFYIYLDPRTNKLIWIPWDFDLSFGGFFLCGSVEERINLSISHPSSVKDPLMARLLAIPEINQRYRQLLKEFNDVLFAPEKFVPLWEATLTQIRAAVIEEGSNLDPELAEKIHVTARKEPLLNRFLIEPGVKAFVRSRHESIEEQLLGKRVGAKPSFWMRMR